MLTISLLQYLRPATVAHMLRDWDENAAGDEREEFFAPLRDIIDTFWDETDHQRFLQECYHLDLTLGGPKASLLIAEGLAYPGILRAKE